MLTIHSCLDDSDSDVNIASGSNQGNSSIVKKKRKKRRKKGSEDAVEHPSEIGRVTRSMARNTPSFASLTTC